MPSGGLIREYVTRGMPDARIEDSYVVQGIASKIGVDTKEGDVVDPSSDEVCRRAFRNKFILPKRNTTRYPE